MGLTSLSYLNRTGVYSYWEDYWVSSVLFRRHYFGGMFVKAVVRDIMEGSFFSTVYLPARVKLGYGRRYKVIKSLMHVKLSRGRTWYFKYQGYVVVLIYTISLGRVRKVRRRRRKIRNYNDTAKLRIAPRRASPVFLKNSKFIF